MSRLARGTAHFLAAAFLSACSRDSTPSAPTAPSPDGLAYLGSVPVAGSRIAVEGCGGTCTETLALDFRAVLRSTIAGAELNVELFDESGRRCSTGLAAYLALASGQAAVISVRSFSIASDCSLPARLVSGKATLRDGQTWRSYAEKSFITDVTFDRSLVTSLDPAVVRITYTDDATQGAAPPRSGGSATLECLVEEHERSGVVLTVTLENGADGWIWINEDDGSKPTTLSSPCVDEPHLFKIGFRAGRPTRAVVTCSAVSGRGRKAPPRSITIPVCCS